MLLTESIKYSEKKRVTAQVVGLKVDQDHKYGIKLSDGFSYFRLTYLMIDARYTIR